MATKRAKRQQSGLDLPNHPNVMTPEQLSNAIRVASQRQVTDPHLWEDLTHRALFLCSTLEPRHLAFIANGYARRGPSIPSDLFERMAGRAVEVIDQCKPRDIALLLNGFARLQLCHLGLLKAASESVRTRGDLSQWSEQHLALVVNAYARCQCRDLALMSFLGRHIATRASELSPQGVANVANGYCRLDLRDTALFRSLASRVVAIAQRMISQLPSTATQRDPSADSASVFSAQHIANVLHAFAQLDLNDPLVFDSLSRLVPHLIATKQLSRPLELAATAHALGRANVTDRPSAAALSRAVEAHASRFTLAQLAAALHGLTRVMGASPTDVRKCCDACVPVVMQKLRDREKGREEGGEDGMWGMGGYPQSVFLLLCAYTRLEQGDAGLLSVLSGTLERMLEDPSVPDQLGGAGLVGSLHALGRGGTRDSVTDRLMDIIVSRDPSRLTAQQVSNLFLTLSKLRAVDRTDLLDQLCVTLISRGAPGGVGGDDGASPSPPFEPLHLANILLAITQLAGPKWTPPSSVLTRLTDQATAVLSHFTPQLLGTVSYALGELECVEATSWFAAIAERANILLEGQGGDKRGGKRGGGVPMPSVRVLAAMSSLRMAHEETYITLVHNVVPHQLPGLTLPILWQLTAAISHAIIHHGSFKPLADGAGKVVLSPALKACFGTALKSIGRDLLERSRELSLESFWAFAELFHRVGVVPLTPPFDIVALHPEIPAALKTLVDSHGHPKPTSDPSKLWAGDLYQHLTEIAIKSASTETHGLVVASGESGPVTEPMASDMLTSILKVHLSDDAAIRVVSFFMRYAELYQSARLGSKGPVGGILDEITDALVPRLEVCHVNDLCGVMKAASEGDTQDARLIVKTARTIRDRLGAEGEGASEVSAGSLADLLESLDKVRPVMAYIRRRGREGAGGRGEGSLLEGLVAAVVACVDVQLSRIVADLPILCRLLPPLMALGSLSEHVLIAAAESVSARLMAKEQPPAELSRAALTVGQCVVKHPSFAEAQQSATEQPFFRHLSTTAMHVCSSRCIDEADVSTCVEAVLLFAPLSDESVHLRSAVLRRGLKRLGDEATSDIRLGDLAACLGAVAPTLSQLTSPDPAQAEHEHEYERVDVIPSVLAILTRLGQQHRLLKASDACTAAYCCVALLDVLPPAPEPFTASGSEQQVAHEQGRDVSRVEGLLRQMLAAATWKKGDMSGDEKDLLVFVASTVRAEYGHLYDRLPPAVRQALAGVGKEGRGVIRA
ncbi:unnamed protein product [Vitrella brassicaformis CCMP3155]|uniref:RNA-editing substrate-binding complex 6 protein domain-containing protein n=1 Tax=Vitrella brassicaformis (strain CCMP3155) TaxID=1169540 RepID=A0A0G4ELA1_VITBC|nr:unnamed protein product [Vitrella brassicaformis CCMP3155]|eukprot:CEL97779.1 unnamed protein product [Vitrella brassicaformis CCMP3155]